MPPNSQIPRRGGPRPRIRTIQKLRGHGPLLQKQHGFGLVAAMFLIIIIAGAIAAMWRISVTQTATSSLSLQQARAYQAARSGLEWGIYQAIKSENCNTEFSPAGMEGFWVIVTCPTPWVVRDEGEEINFYSLSSTAQYSSPGNPDYAYRKLEAVVEVPDSGTGG